MTILENSLECCGCGACEQICRANAIMMKEDKDGFLYPFIDNNRCVNCGLCIKTCPIINKYVKKSNLGYYAFQSKNKKVREVSTAGGAFYTFGSYVIENGGVVFGAGFDDNYKVLHLKAENIAQLIKLCMSKYVQSELGGIFHDVKKELDDDRMVLFAGTPCQCEGLVGFLGRKYDNLLLLDFLCHGVPSPKVWKKYIDTMCTKYGASEFAFRSKELGYKKSSMAFTNSDGNRVICTDASNNDIKFMTKAFFGEICSRPCCHACNFKTTKRVTDATLGDMWNIRKYNESYDDDYGTSFITIRSEKMLNILAKINLSEDVRCFPIKLSDYLKDDGVNMINSMPQNSQRTSFFCDLDKLSLNELYSKYLDRRERFLKLKWFLNKIGILYVLRNLKYSVREKNYKRNMK